MRSLVKTASSVLTTPFENGFFAHLKQAAITAVSTESSQVVVFLNFIVQLLTLLFITVVALAVVVIKFKRVS